MRMNTGAVGITTEDSPKRKPFLLAFDDISSQIKIRKNVSYVRPEFSKKHGAFRTSNNSEKNSFRAKESKNRTDKDKKKNFGRTNSFQVKLGIKKSSLGQLNNTNSIKKLSTTNVHKLDFNINARRRNSSSKNAKRGILSDSYEVKQSKEAQPNLHKTYDSNQRDSSQSYLNKSPRNPVIGGRKRSSKLYSESTRTGGVGTLYNSYGQGGDSKGFFKRRPAIGNKDSQKTIQYKIKDDVDNIRNSNTLPGLHSLVTQFAGPNDNSMPSSQLNKISRKVGVSDSLDTKQEPQTPPGPSFKYYVYDITKAFQKGGSAYFKNIYKEHFKHTFMSLRFIRTLRPPPKREIITRKKKLKRREKDIGKRTLVLDLDETLIHCNTAPGAVTDLSLPVSFPTGENISAPVNLRPYVKNFLTAMAEIYEVIVFTASHSCYADVVINHLDPTGELISNRLYRDSCIQTDSGVFVKDLGVLGDRDLKETVLVDNATYSFAYQLNNGIPIIPFYDSKDDIELKKLEIFLKKLVEVEDMRQVLKEHFKFKKSMKCLTQEEALRLYTTSN